MVPRCLALMITLGLVTACDKKPTIGEALEAARAESRAKAAAGKAEAKKVEAKKALEQVVPAVSLTSVGVTRSDPVMARSRAISLSGMLGSMSLGFAEDLTVEVGLRGAAGTAVKIGDQSLAIPTGGLATHRLDVKPALLAALKGLPLKPGKVIFPPHLTIPVERSKDGLSNRGELRVELEPLALFWTRVCAKKGLPMTLPGEGGGANKRASLLSNAILRFNHLGAPITWENLDLIAMEHFEKTRTRGCGTYRGTSGSTQTFEISLQDQKITVHDRRTGKLIATKRFSAQGRCPRSTKMSDSRSFYVDSAKMEAWLLKQLKK